MSIQTWVNGLVKTAVDEAMADLKADILAEIQTTESNLTTEITSLPGLLGSQIQNVAVDATALAQNVISGVAAQVAQFPAQIAQAVLQLLPFPFKGP